MSNMVQFPTHNVVGTTQIQNNSYPSPAQRGLEAGSSLQSSSKESGGFFRAILNFFKWLFCCSGDKAEELSVFGKFFETKIKEAWPQHKDLDSDAARMEAAVRIVEGDFGNMEDPARTHFRLDFARELLKRDDLSTVQRERMHASLTILANNITGVDTTTLETTIEGIAGRAEWLRTRMSDGTQLKKDFLLSHLESRGFLVGQAVDNGDCFFAAFAESLSHLKGEQFTHKQMRCDVAAAPRSDMIIQRIGADRSAGGYSDIIEWGEKVAQSCDEGVVPIWGRGNIGGVLLCNKYQVNLVVYDVYADHESALQIAENEFTPEGGKAAETIYMASYPGHFFPIIPRAGA
ncbi:MAG: hypothetical protein K940chlam2_00441 [Chlamydiae bacterium]|nr:hypothetical protein [Chlamydiota bacterium]